MTNEFLIIPRLLDIKVNYMIFLKNWFLAIRRKISKPSVAIIICIEHGILEFQSVLLVMSIRKFGGQFKDVPIYAYSPREGHEIAQKTKDILRQLDVTHSDLVLNTGYPDNGFANKIFAAAYSEKQLSADIVVFMDSDMIVLSEPKDLILPPGVDLAIRPVEHKNVGATGSDDPNYSFWEKMYSVLNVEEFRYVDCTTTGETVLEYFNAGLLICRRNAGVFECWKKNFKKVMDAELIPAYGEHLFLEQACFAATVSQMKTPRKILDRKYNYPAQLHFNMSERSGRLESENIVITHYHKLLNTNEGREKLLTALGDGIVRQRVEHMIEDVSKILSD